MKLLPPARFRLHEDDRATYGADWYVYDEAKLVRLPLGELKAIEQALGGMSIPEMINRARLTYADATQAAMWVARRMAGVTETLDDFQPLVLLADWEPVNGGGDADPPASSSSSTPEEPEPS